MAPRTTMLRGHESINVAGESHYQDALRELAADAAPRLRTIAHLIPEPDNEHDAHAVRVEIDGRKVGYLPRAIAGDYGALLAPIAARGRVAACEATVVGSADSAFGVFLDLPAPDDPR